MSDDLLSRKYGPETINFFAGSTLNRFSFKRTDHAFLSASLLDPTTRFLAFNALDPLADAQGKLILLEHKDVESIIGNPYETSDADKIANWSASDDTTIVIYLGADEGKPTAQGGEAFFAVDVTPLPQQREEAKKKFIETYTTDGRSFKNVRVGVKMAQHEAAMVAMGRSLIDWNARNGYCSGCGGKTIGVWAGAKRQCPEKDRVQGDRLPCISRKGLHNFQYPRTDAVIIMGILSRDGKKMLLGRQKAWPQGMFSCLAGFIEPGESLEEAVRREVWEESGVKVSRVQYASSQPWPFPSNLMIGCIGVAEDGGETIDLGNDPELETAKWFTREELSNAGEMGKEDKSKDPSVSVPPDMAIARKLIDCFVRDDWGLDKL